MIINSENNTSVVTLKGVFNDEVLVNFNRIYDKISLNNIIIDLLAIECLGINEVLKFYSISNKHRDNKLSFVIVSNNISYEDIPEDLIVVPTLLEAKDIIDMEEMERDLGLDELEID